MQLSQFIDDAVSAHCGSVGVRCGTLANTALGFLGSRAGAGRAAATPGTCRKGLLGVKAEWARI